MSANVAFGTAFEYILSPCFVLASTVYLKEQDRVYLAEAFQISIIACLPEKFPCSLR
jgi:hypothetical protein